MAGEAWYKSKNCQIFTDAGGAQKHRRNQDGFWRAGCDGFPGGEAVSYTHLFVMIGMILLLTVITENFLSYNNILNVLSTISINGDVYKRQSLMV